MHDWIYHTTITHACIESHSQILRPYRMDATCIAFEILHPPPWHGHRCDTITVQSVDWFVNKLILHHGGHNYASQCQTQHDTQHSGAMNHALWYKCIWKSITWYTNNSCESELNSSRTTSFVHEIYMREAASCIGTFMKTNNHRCIRFLY